MKKLTRSTVFVPTNSAFVSLFYDLDYTELDDFAKLALEDVVEVHFEPDDTFLKFELENRCGELMRMENGDSTRTICEYKDKDRFYQRGPSNVQGDIPRIIEFDIEACNGVIHVVNRVILPR